jgi:uncharacterized protein YeaO (DUF488 family)
VTVKVKRVYQEPAKGDGLRVLVDRLWPRGMSKDAVHLDLWLKEVAPSTALRRWYGHEPSKWEEFKRRYFRELDCAPEPVNVLMEQAGEGKICLLFAAKDEERNNAVALKEYLEERFGL